jgi:hypothetical protein
MPTLLMLCLCARATPAATTRTLYAVDASALPAAAARALSGVPSGARARGGLLLVVLTGVPRLGQPSRECYM